MVDLPSISLRKKGALSPIPPAPSTRLPHIMCTPLYFQSLLSSLTPSECQMLNNPLLLILFTWNVNNKCVSKYDLVYVFMCFRLPPPPEVFVRMLQRLLYNRNYPPRNVTTPVEGCNSSFAGVNSPLSRSIFIPDIFVVGLQEVDLTTHGVYYSIFLFIH
jgi:hypothetical protein